MANVDRINQQQIASYNRAQQARESGQAQAAREQRTAEQRAPDRPQADNVSVSDRGRDLQRVAEYVRQLPDVRQERVDELRQQLQAGTYDVPAENVAAKLLGGS